MTLLRKFAPIACLTLLACATSVTRVDAGAVSMSTASLSVEAVGFRVGSGPTVTDIPAGLEIDGEQFDPIRLSDLAGFPPSGGNAMLFADNFGLGSLADGSFGTASTITASAQAPPNSFALEGLLEGGFIMTLANNSNELIEIDLFAEYALTTSSFVNDPLLEFGIGDAGVFLGVDFLSAASASFEVLFDDFIVSDSVLGPTSDMSGDPSSLSISLEPGDIVSIEGLVETFAAVSSEAPLGNAVPEPTTLAGFAAMGLLLTGRRRRRL